MKLKQLIAMLAIVAAGSTQAANVLLSEGFDDVTTLAGSGWVQTNNSTAGGTTGWFQGNPGVFDAASGAPNSYIGANFNNAGIGGAISNWLLTPELSFSDGATLNFALRLLGDGYLDTVEIYRSTSGASTDVGSSSSSTGVFSLIGTYSSLVDTGWLSESVVVSGISGTANGRFAFRYVAADTNVDANYIGIDSVRVDAAEVVPEPASLALAGVALGGLALSRRRQRPQGQPGIDA